MKLAYLGKVQLSDVDLSYLNEAQKLADITCVFETNPRFQRGPAFSLQAIYPKSGVFKAVDIYPELERLQGFIDTDKLYVVNTSGRLWQLKSFWTHLLLLRFLIKGHYDAIHLAWPPNIYEFVLYFLRRKMLLTVHDPFPHTAHNSLIVKIRRKVAFSLIPKLIILNKAQSNHFIQHYRLKDDRVINSSLSSYTYLNTIVPTRENIPDNGSYILFAGRISPYKGIDYLLPAMEKVNRQCPDCRLIVAGGGKYHFDISRYKKLDYIDIRNRFIPDDELVALLQHAAFVVCPYTDATQSGVIMSAYAFCKPVVATNVGGLPEMVHHGHYGLIVKNNDTDALAEAICQLWKNQDQLQHFSRQIEQDYIEGELSWRKIAHELNVVYRKNK